MSDKAQLNTKKWWSILKSVYQNADMDKSIPPIKNNNSFISDLSEKCELFNNYFLSNSDIDVSNVILPPVNPGLEENTLDFIVITEQDVKDQISLLNIKKAYGPDGISPIFLKEGGTGIVKSLTLLFNSCLQQQIMPSTWKQANVLPLFKKGSRSDLNNYRPISLLSCVSKLFEKIIHKYLYNFLLDNSLISCFQSGFLPGKSTTTQLIEIYHKMCKSLDDNKEVRVVFLDITKAFDKVYHRGLLHKLRECGIKGRLLGFFQDYLRGRQQRVSIGGSFSSWGILRAGVPQGSVLGPLLFLIYINDITSVIEHSNIRMFADDTCLFLEIEDRAECARKIDSDLTRISNWAQQWAIQFSASKTKSLIISNKKDFHCNPTVYLNGIPIEEVKSYKYLGIHLTSNLRWNLHIDNTCLKAQKLVNMIRPLKFLLDRRSLEMIYKSFVLPVIEYGSVVWGGSYDSDLRKLDSLQIDALRIITGATARSSITALYKETNFIPISEKCKITKLIMFYKIHTGVAPYYLCDLIPTVTNQGHYNLRSKEAIPIPVTRLKTFDQSFFPSTINLWNKLSSDIRNQPTLSGFKKELIGKRDTPVYYYYGERWACIHHARLRMGCSKLAYDLTYNLRVSQNPICRLDEVSEFRLS